MCVPFLFCGSGTFTQYHALLLPIWDKLDTPVWKFSHAHNYTSILELNIEHACVFVSWRLILLLDTTWFGEVGIPLYFISQHPFKTSCQTQCLIVPLVLCPATASSMNLITTDFHFCPHLIVSFGIWRIDARNLYRLASFFIIFVFPQNCYILVDKLLHKNDQVQTIIYPVYLICLLHLSLFVSSVLVINSFFLFACFQFSCLLFQTIHLI